LMTIKPWGLIFAPGTFDSAGFKKLLGMPVVRFISLLANGQSDTQWLPRHLLHFQCGGGFAPSANAFWPLYLTQCLSLYISVELLIILEILSSSVSPSLLAPLSPGMLANVEVCCADANTAASTPFSSSQTFFFPSPRGARWTVRVVFLLINSSSSRYTCSVWLFVTTRSKSVTFPNFFSRMIDRLRSLTEMWKPSHGMGW